MTEILEQTNRRSYRKHQKPQHGHLKTIMNKQQLINKMTWNNARFLQQSLREEDNQTPTSEYTNTCNHGSAGIPAIMTFEIEAAWKEMKKNKVLGDYAFVLEGIKAGEWKLIAEIKSLFNKCLAKWKIPSLCINDPHI